MAIALPSERATLRAFFRNVIQSVIVEGVATHEWRPAVEIVWKAEKVSPEADTSSVDGGVVVF